MSHLDDRPRDRSGKAPELRFAVTVRVVLKEANRPLPGVSVLLYDRGTLREEDLLGRAQTNSAGVARFLVDAGRFRDRVGDGKGPGPGEWSLPDLCAVVADADGLPVLTARRLAVPDARRARLQVSVPYETALRRGLIRLKPGRSVARKRDRWHDGWKRVLDKQEPGTRPPVDFCLVRALLDAMSGLDAPGNRLQKQAAKALNGRASPEQLRELARLGREGVAMVDRLGVTSENCTSMLDPKEIVDVWLRDGGPLENLSQNLLFHAPPPDAGLPMPRAGEAFMTPWTDWFKDCIVQYLDTEENGAPWPHDPQALEDMRTYYLDRLMLMEPPSVNEVEAYDPLYRDNVRLAEVGARRMIVVDYDAIEGRRELDLNMHVPLTDGSCLYKLADPDSPDPGEHQALVVDVKPGQTVVFKGSGFISRQAEIQAQFARWEPAAFDAEGRLVPRAFGPAPVLNGRLLDVFGTLMPHDGYTPQTYTGDWVLLEWPDTEPGLYKVTLKFANAEGLAAGASQDMFTCDLTIESLRDVATQTLWFAVLPEKEAQTVRMRATQLTCVDEKDPEWVIINLCDDILLQTSAFLSQYTWNGDDFDHTDSAPVQPSAQNQFWNDGDAWNLVMNLLPEDGTFHTLGLNEAAFATLLAAEVFGEFDRNLLKLLIIAIVAIVIVLFLAALVAAVLALVLIPEIALPVDVAIALLGGGGLIALLAAFLFGTFFNEIVAAVTAMLAGLTGADLVAIGNPAVSGAELAERLSPLRVHKLFPRPSAATTTVSGPLTVAAEQEFRDREIEYRYTCTDTELQSTYRLHVMIQRP